MRADEELVAHARDRAFASFRRGRRLLQRALHVGVLLNFFDFSLQLVFSSLHVLQAIDDDARNRGNDLAIIRVIAGERCQHKLSSVRHFDIRDVVSRSAGPTSFGPQAKAFAALERHAGKAASLIVSIVGLLGVVAFQKIHHGRGARRVRDFAGNDLHHQTCGRVGRQFVPVLAFWTTRNAFTPISIFAKRLLVDVDVGVTQRGEVTIDGVAFVLPLLHLFRRQLVAGQSCA